MQQSFEIIDPKETQRRMAAIGLSQFCLATLANVSPTKINRFLRGNTSSLNTVQYDEVKRVLEECEFLASVFTPLFLNFRDHEAVKANLIFLRKTKDETVREFLRAIVNQQFSAVTALDQPAPASAVA